jgi:hypothetical protein
MEERRVFENRIRRRILGPKKDERVGSGEGFTLKNFIVLLLI